MSLSPKSFIGSALHFLTGLTSVSSTDWLISYPGLAVTLDAAFTYAWSYLHFPEQITQEGLEPHQVLEAYLWGGESPDTYVEIEDYVDLKAESLGRHTSQMGSWDPVERAKRIRQWSARQGEDGEQFYVEEFRRIRFDLGSLACQLMNI